MPPWPPQVEQCPPGRAVPPRQGPVPCLPMATRLQECQVYHRWQLEGSWSAPRARSGFQPGRLLPCQAESGGRRTEGDSSLGRPTQLLSSRQDAQALPGSGRDGRESSLVRLPGQASRALAESVCLLYVHHSQASHPPQPGELLSHLLAASALPHRGRDTLHIGQPQPGGDGSQVVMRKIGGGGK